MSDRSTYRSQGLSGSLKQVPRLAHGEPNRERDQDENAGIENSLALVRRILVPLISFSQLGSLELRSYSSHLIHHRDDFTPEFSTREHGTASNLRSTCFGLFYTT